MNDDKTIKNLLIFFFVVILFYLLKELSTILLPFVLALLMVLVVQPLINYLQSKKVPNWLILPLIAIITLAIIFGVGFIFVNTISNIYDQKDFLLSKLLTKTDYLLTFINSTFNLKLDTTLLVSEVYKSFVGGTLGNLLSNIVGSLGSFFSSFLFFALYYVMLLAGIANYKEFLIYVGGYKQEAVLNEYENLQKSVNSYIVIKTLISIATGLLTYVIAEIFGIQFSLFWGFVAFIFNFIPNIGSIAGVLLPVTMSVIQLDSFQQILTFSLLLIVMQFLMGNFVEPIIMGNRLRLNTPTVLIGLVFWGYIWGIPGMILSVPLLVIIKIILEKYPEYSMIARLMGYPDKK